MNAARASEEILFNDSPIQLFADLSGRTLQLCTALCLLLDLLKEREIPYRWGFLFQLTAHKDGAWATCLIFLEFSNYPRYAFLNGCPPPPSVCQTSLSGVTGKGPR